MMVSVEESFTAFYLGWLIILQNFLNQIQAALSTITTENDDQEQEEESRKLLISRVFNHYEEYFKKKHEAAKEDIFLVLSAPWITSFQRVLIWFSCFKPSMLLLLIHDLMGNEFTPRQARLVLKIQTIVKRKERRIETAMAMVQERVSDFTLNGMLRPHGRLINGEISRLEQAMEELKAAMLLLMENADRVRAATVRWVLKILTQTQTIKLLAAAAHYSLHTRNVGLHADSQPEASAAAIGSYVGGGGGGEDDETLPYDP